MSLSLWFRNQETLIPIEIDSSASINDLYQRIGQELNRTDFRLTFAGNLIEEEQGSLADVGLSNEAVIGIISEMPIWESMQRIFGDILVDKEQVRWWKAAKRCRLGLDLELCSEDAICHSPIWTAYDFIECQHGKVVRIKMDRATPYRLRGTLNLDHIPRSVQLLSLLEKSIAAVHFKGLSNGKSLIILDLHENPITTINLRELKGSSLEMLYLYSNEISGTLDLGDLQGSNLKGLYLTGNFISDVTFGNMTDCPLEALDLAMNPIQRINFGGIIQSKLTYLNLGLWSHERHLLQRVQQISELKEAQIAGGDTFQYLIEHHSHVPGVASVPEVKPKELRALVIPDQSQFEILAFTIVFLLFFLKYVLRVEY